MLLSKPCTRCGEPKPLSDFYARTNGAPQSACKVCMKAANAVSNRERMRKVRAYHQQQREYAKAAIEGRIAA